MALVLLISSSLFVAPASPLAVSPCDQVFAELLLTAPVGTPEVPPAERWDAVRLALRQTAIERELLDPREVGYFDRLTDYQYDLDLLRRRAVELADAPPLADARRLPDRSATWDFLQFNRSFRCHVEERMAWELDRVGRFLAVVEETDTLYQVWDTVHDATSGSYYVTTRRQALARLRDQIGADAYAAGELPPCVPVWRFVDVPLSQLGANR